MFAAAYRRVMLRATHLRRRVTSRRVGFFVSQSLQYFYPSQTKMLEGGTKEEIRIFRSIFKVVSTRFGLRIVENSIENAHFIFCSSFQNLRLGSIVFPTKNQTNITTRILFVEADRNFKQCSEQNRAFYPFQTKILEGRTNLSERIFRSTFQRCVAQIEYSHP